MNGRHSILRLAVIAAALWPLAAMEVPESRREFVESVAAGKGATRMEKLVVERDFDEIYRLLAMKSATWLDVQVRRSGFVGNQMEVSSSDYNPTLTRVGRNGAEFALQVVLRPLGVGPSIPPDGLYVMAADIRSLSKGRTEVMLYRPTIGFKKIVGSLKQRTAGESADCPKIK